MVPRIWPGQFPPVLERLIAISLCNRCTRASHFSMRGWPSPHGWRTQLCCPQLLKRGIRHSAQRCRSTKAISSYLFGSCFDFVGFLTNVSSSSRASSKAQANFVLIEMIDTDPLKSFFLHPFAMLLRPTLFNRASSALSAAAQVSPCRAGKHSHY